jgi:type I restriction-modification system DNA methylase subunit
MNIKKCINSIYRLLNDIRSIEKSLIYLFLIKNSFNVEDSLFFKDYLKEIDVVLISEINNILFENDVTLDLDILVSFFESLTPNDEKKENGVIFTPKEIKDHIIESLVKDDRPPTICDPACGCGSFLISASKYLKDKYKIPYADIYDKYIYGVDIIPHNIEKAKVLLHLLALIDDEYIGDAHFNLEVGNSLSFDWQEAFFDNMEEKFDLVIGNPPYVRAKNINAEVKDSLSGWETAQIGNPDLYIPFYELGIKILGDKGKLGYISINTFLKSLNGRGLRKFLGKNKFEIKIIDFNEEQIFKSVTSYTCVTLIDKEKKSDKLLYCSFRKGDDLKYLTYTENSLSCLNKDETKSWLLGEVKDLNILNKIKSQPVPLSDFVIKNGLATLKNELYFFSVIDEDAKYYYREYENSIYKIEKGICKDIAKPNIMKNEADLERLMEKGIFPYVIDEQNNYKIIPEDIFRNDYPETYSFLTEYKDILNARDKGKANEKYPAWYAYGRTQGLNNIGKKVLLPYIADKPIAITSLREDILFYCGYAVISENERELMFIKKILLSNIFWFFIKKTSKPYSKGYMSIAKSYITQFAIPFLNETDKELIINEVSQEIINELLIKRYNFSESEKILIENSMKPTV